MHTASPNTDLTTAAPPPVATVLLGWLAMIGVDLFLNAGILAPLYNWNGPFLLSPLEAFYRIPVGYLAFLLIAGALFWLLDRLGVRRGRDAALLAGSAGAVVWGALLLSVWSISTAEGSLLAAWWIGQTAQLAIAGYVMGAALSGARLRSVAAAAVAILLVGAISAAVLQSIGFAPAPIVING